MKNIASLRLSHGIAACACLVLMSGCKESSENLTTITGNVADGYLQGVKVCLDKNTNSHCDADEPFDISISGGVFQLKVTTGEENLYPLVAEVPSTAIDEDFNTTVDSNYTMSTPKGKRFISPLTTKVQVEIYGGASLSDAEIKASSDLNLSDHARLYSNYIQDSNVELHKTAQYLASILQKPLVIVSTPNPNIFPLLIAMDSNPTLPIKLIPVSTSSEIDTAFSTNGGEALLSMTYTAANKVTSNKIKDLQLVDIGFWRGFWQITPTDANIKQFSDLKGKGVIVSGPTSGGKGGGPDFIFQAALKRANMSTSDIKLCYLPVMTAVPMISSQANLNTNSACDPTFNLPASSLSMVEPAATGTVVNSLVNGTTALKKTIDMQTLFTGYSKWPATQLPHGGLSMLKSVLDDSNRTLTRQTVIKAYHAAIDKINASKKNPEELKKLTEIISVGIDKYYGAYGLSIPSQVIAISLLKNELIYRDDLNISAIQSDLSPFLNEVVGTTVPKTFYRY